MTPTPSGPLNRQVRVLLSASSLLSVVPIRNAAAVSIAELGVGAFFLAGTIAAIAGPATPWLISFACLLGLFVRAIDIESWSLLIPGGLIGRTRQSFGLRASAMTGAVVLTERLLLVALAATVVGHYLASLVSTGITVTGYRSPAVDDVASLVAVALIAFVWIRARLGRDVDPVRIAHAIWIAIGILTLIALWGALSLTDNPLLRFRALIAPSLSPSGEPWPSGWLPYVLGIALALPAMGGGDALARTAHELPLPRVQSMLRTNRLVLLVALATTAAPAWLFFLIVPASAQPAWLDTPLTGAAHFLAGPALLRGVGAFGLSVAAVLILGPAVQAAMRDVEHILRRLGTDRILPEGLTALHPRFGTSSQAIDASAAAAILMVVAGGGRVAWLGWAYAFGFACALLVKVATLVRFRRIRREAPAFRIPPDVRLAGRVIPAGLVGTGLAVGVALASMILSRNPATIAVGVPLAGLTVLLTSRAGRSEGADKVAAADLVELLPSSEFALDQVQARPGNILVPVRNPHALDHVVAALRTPEDRDVVVMTARLIGVDVDEEVAGLTGNFQPTENEQQLFSRVIALAERYQRPVRLVIVPARNVFDSVIATVMRLRSAEVFVGESVSLTGADQAKLLGDAWERVDKPETLSVRLVIYHRSGRADSYQLGAHLPPLNSADLDLIHRIWLDAAKTIGPHVHHRDVVRAALTTMEQQLNGPERDRALDAIRLETRPADELAAAVHNRDFTRLRDMVRNRPAGDLAALLTVLTLEDQVVVFRVLPRKDAAAVFEYLSHDAQETLLKAMAQEDIAALLNNMAPDDRTMFLEELPAAATRQLLSLLTPAERTVALSLLGYPENSVGRLMTPQYVAARESWTIREVLDYIRAHGQDSETLNVVYVVDDQGLLIDDIRIREFLLAPLERRVSDLMDRHFAALKATDDQQTAVAAFRKYDRSALPVTDTAGMLIGIVTIDDVLDVAEEAATEEIQRIGGSEALDEPYMQIAFLKMIQKRAGWLTALFLGEMLTATAMSSFGGEISRAVVLSFFIPLIISSGGNSGSQASTLVIRAMALGEVTLSDWWRVMRREIGAGLALGSILGAIGFLRITVWSQFVPTYGEHWLLIGVTVAIALVGVVLWGTLSGSLLPLLLRRLGFDPATSSAPFVATLVDVTGLVIYFSVATVILRGTLL